MRQLYKEHAAALLAAGYEPIPIPPGLKAPKFTGWSQIELTPEVVDGWAANGKAGHYIGIRTGRVAALDLDLDDADAVGRLIAHADATLGPTLVRYGRPGRALLVYAIEGEVGAKAEIRLVRPDGEAKSIDILQHGQQFVAFGVHPDTGNPYRWDGESPLDVPISDLPRVTARELIEWAKAAVESLPGWSLDHANAPLDDDARFLLGYRPAQAVEAMTPEQRVNHEAMLDFAAWVPDLLPSAREYHGGYRVTSKALGRDLEEDLSLVPGGIYDFGEERGMTPLQVVEKWGDQADALAWLAERVGVDLTAQAESAERVEKAAQESTPSAKWAARLEAATSVPQLKKVQDAIQRANLDRADRALLAAALGTAYQRLTGARVPMADLRRLVAPRAKPRHGSDLPEWAEGWVYVTHTDRFFELGAGRIVSAQGWDHLFRHRLPSESDGAKPSAVDAIKQIGLPTVDNVLYHPAMGQTFTMAGKQYANSFVPESIPEAAETLTAEDRAAQAIVEEHFWHLSTGRREVQQWLMEWVAFVVQHPGQRVRWAPLICGVEGDGKSILLLIFSVCIGAANVRPIGPQVVTSQFNGYAQGSMVVLLEEIRVAGQNRHEVLNNLKPLITNDVVDVHRKGADSYLAPNVVNYVACTNHTDALPMTEGDRRFGMVSTQWQNLNEMADVVGMPADQYFERLTRALRDHGPAIRRLFLDYKIGPTFRQHGPAPMTREKSSAVAVEQDSELTQAIEAAAAEGVRGVTVQVVCTDVLRGAAADFVPGLQDLPKGRALSKAMLAAGYTRHPERVKWDGHPRTVWTKGRRHYTTQEVRDMLDASTSK